MGYRIKVKREVTCYLRECYEQKWIDAIAEFNTDGRLIRMDTDWDSELPDGWRESYKGYECPAHNKDVK